MSAPTASVDGSVGCGQRRDVAAQLAAAVGAGEALEGADDPDEFDREADEDEDDAEEDDDDGDSDEDADDPDDESPSEDLLAPVNEPDLLSRLSVR